MTKKEYLRELKARLAHLPQEERDEALKYYEEYFEEAQEKNVEEIIEELGTPEEVAEKIIADFNQDMGDFSQYEYRANTTGENKAQKGKGNKVLKIILGIFIGIVALTVILAIAGGMMFKSIVIRTIDNGEAIFSKMMESEDSFQEPILEGDSQKGEVNLSDKKFDSLKLSDLASNFEVEQGSEWKLSYNLHDPEQLQIAVSPDDGRNVLKISYPLTKEDHDRNENEKIVLTIPKEAQIDSFDVENCLGKINLSGVSCRELDLEGNISEISISDLMAQESISINQSLGKINMNKVKTAKLEISDTVGKTEGTEVSVSQMMEIEESLGTVELQGSFPCNMKVEENIGKIDLEVTGATQQDYNYRIVESMGGYQIGDLSSKTIGASFEKDNKSAKNILIKGNMGKVSINFR